MAALGRRGLETVLDFIGDSRSDDGVLPFTEEGVDRLKSLVHCEYARYKEMDFARQVEIARLPCSAERSDFEDDLEEEMTKADWDEVGRNPCYQASRTEPGRIFITSELRSRGDAGSAYVEAWEEELGECGGAVDRMWIGIDGPSWGGFAFDRCEQPFGDGDLQLARFLQPHLGGLWRQAAIRRRLTAALWALDHDHAEGVLLMGPSGLEFASDRAQRLLRDYFGITGVRIPDTMMDWYGDDRQMPFVVVADGSELVVEAAHSGSTLFLRERAIGVELLTAREREVMQCVAEGLSTNEIARRLWIQPGTARKHLEHVYGKLGVRSRTAALAKLRVGSSEDAN
jgi:DNA-binding CsgD family transcriptional regulator